MSLYVWQWLVIIVIDLMLRFGYFVAADGVAGMTHVLYPSASHLSLLLVVNYSLELLGLRVLWATVIVIVVTNALFAVEFFFVAFVFGGDRTVEGLAIQVAINLVPVLLALELGRDGAAPGPEPLPRAGRSTLVELRARQWILLVALDVVLRQAEFFPVPVLLLFGLILRLPVSFVHLALLVLVNYSLARFPLRGWRAVALLLLVTNTVFAVGSVLYQVTKIKLGRLGGGVGDTPYWIDGVITPAGVHYIVEGTAIHVAINVTCVLAACALGGNLGKQSA